MGGLPGSVLFACNFNAVRSPIAESIMKKFYGHIVYVDSAGVRRGVLDPFGVAVMAEIGIDLAGHRPKTFNDLLDGSYDLIISLAPEAHHRAIEMTRTMACEVEYWNTLDPTIVQGNRETRIDAYRALRDGLTRKITGRFSAGPPPVV